jgi:hypothetical protein
MKEHEQAGRARMIGYTIGLAAVVVMLVWKLLVR